MALNNMQVMRLKCLQMAYPEAKDAAIAHRMAQTALRFNTKRFRRCYTELAELALLLEASNAPARLG